MKHLEDLFAVLPTFVLKWLFALLLGLKMGDEVRTALYYELRFREQLDEEVASSRRKVYGRSVIIERKTYSTKTAVSYGRIVRGIA